MIFIVKTFKDHMILSLVKKNKCIIMFWQLVYYFTNHSISFHQRFTPNPSSLISPFYKKWINSRITEINEENSISYSSESKSWNIIKQRNSTLFECAMFDPECHNFTIIIIVQYLTLIYFPEPNIIFFYIMTVFF